MFFDNWYGLVRVAVVGTLAYGGLVAILRVSGKRTLTKMNAFDLVVTVALGSTLASILLTSGVSLSEGLLAFVVLIGLQYVVTWSSVRWKWVSKAVKAEPRLLYYRGEMLHDALKRERVTESDVLEQVRGSGLDSLEQVEAIVLETAGEVSVIHKDGNGGERPLRGIGGYERVRHKNRSMPPTD